MQKEIHLTQYIFACMLGKIKTKCGIPNTTKDWIVVIIVCF